MENILLIIHAILAILLIGIVLIQRAEGGALGIGGGSDGMSPRGSADLLTRSTALIASLFIITSIALTIVSIRSSDNISIMDDEDLSIELDIEGLPELPQLD
jgi:preprotein translocase subunit SecG